MKALLSTGQGQLQLTEIDRPPLGPGDLLLRVHACGVCFSDIHKIYYRDRQKAAVLGHEIAGIVDSCGAEVKAFRPGDRVVVAHHVPCMSCHYCLHGSFSMCPQFKTTALDPGGFSEYVRVPQTHAQRVAFKTPEGLSNNEACFMEPLACCWRNIKRLGLRKGDRVIVLGLGSVGLLLVQLVRHVGAIPIGIELDADRRKTATTLGCADTFTGREPNFKTSLDQLTSGRRADAVIVTAGNPGLVPTLLTWLRDGGTLNIFASFHPDSEIQIDWNALYYHEINVVTTYSSSPEDLKEALDLLAQRAVQVSALANHTFALDQFATALDALKKKTILKAILTPHARG